MGMRKPGGGFVPELSPVALKPEEDEKFACVRDDPVAGDCVRFRNGSDISVLARKDDLLLVRRSGHRGEGVIEYFLDEWKRNFETGAVKGTVVRGGAGSFACFRQELKQMVVEWVSGCKTVGEIRSFVRKLVKQGASVYVVVEEEGDFDWWNGIKKRVASVGGL